MWNSFQRTISTDPKIQMLVTKKLRFMLYQVRSSRCMVRLLEKYLERVPPKAEYVYVHETLG